MADDGRSVAVKLGVVGGIDGSPARPAPAAGQGVAVQRTAGTPADRTYSPPSTQTTHIVVNGAASRQRGGRPDAAPRRRRCGRAARRSRSQPGPGFRLCADGLASVPTGSASASIDPCRACLTDPRMKPCSCCAPSHWSTTRRAVSGLAGSGLSSNSGAGTSTPKRSSRACRPGSTTTGRSGPVATGRYPTTASRSP
jgi:hypothetical protein